VRDRFTRRRSKPNGLVLLHGRVTGNAVAERHSNDVDAAKFEMINQCGDQLDMPVT